MIQAKILVVDSSKESCEALTELLKDEYEIECVCDKEQALKSLEKNYQLYQLLLLDINTPEVDGFGILEILRERGILSELPVIVVSERVGSDTINHSYELGAMDFLVRPYAAHIVKNRVRNVMKMHRNTFRDYLTDGYNRKGFIRMVENFLANTDRKEDYAILFFDIKKFKAVNDLFGIQGGDSLLAYFYQKLMQSPIQPIFLSRIQADHFVCFAEKRKIDFEYLTVQHEEFVYNGKTLHLHFDCGIYYIEDVAMTVSGMIDRAKLAKEYIVDEYIKPYAIFDHEMRIAYVDKAKFLEEFDDSIGNEEIKVYFQPVMNAITGELVSAEALVRWQHPEKGLISPAVFIPTLEKDGYISKLDWYVIQRVCEMIQSRVQAGLPIVPISVNLSWMDFYDETLMGHIIELLQSGKLPPDSLRYEITETSYAALEENRSVALDKLRELGSKILLDDFGAGYSSFGMLKEYNFDILKIDMSFTRQIETNNKVKSILHAIIDMCHQMGIQVVAEGAETEAQVTFLQNHGCDYIQGYYFSPPMNEQDFLQLLEEKGRLKSGKIDRLTEIEVVYSYFKNPIYYLVQNMRKSSGIESAVADKLLAQNSAVGILCGCYDDAFNICYISNFSLMLLDMTLSDFLSYTKGSFLKLVAEEDRKIFSNERFQRRIYSLVNHVGKKIRVKEVRQNCQSEDGRLQWVASIRCFDDENESTDSFVFGDQTMEETAKKLVLKQVLQLNAASDMNEAISAMLKAVGEFMAADRAYIFEVDEDCYNNTFEWCAPGVTKEIMNLQGVPADEISIWIDKLKKNQCVVIPSVADIRESEPIIYGYLEPQSITSVIEAPLMYEGELRGFIGLDNAPQENVRMLADSLRTLGMTLAIALRKRDEHDAIVHRADYDGMTDLLKKGVAKKKVDEILINNPNSQHAMLFLDLDDFKQINDRWGHDAGDYALVCVSRMLKEKFCKKDLIARYGGDEFFIFLENIKSIDSVEKYAAQILESLSECTKEKYPQMQVHGSIGIAFSEKKDTVEELLRKSDKALYAAKFRGKNQYYFHR